jgi:hypothetical protein
MAKGWPATRRACRHSGLVVVALLAGLAGAIGEGPRDGDVWYDRQTGFAIGGYDPVAYFVRHAAKIGTRGIELTTDDVTWLFESRANRAVFERDPGVYTPRFAARDPMQLARGFEALGSPHHWVIEDGALYLFANSETRIEWLKAPQRERASAEANWPELMNTTQ